MNIPSVDEAFKNKMKDRFGLSVTNPVNDSSPAMTYLMKSSPQGESPFTYQSDAQRLHQNLMQQEAERVDDFNVMKSAQTNTYYNNPHHAMRTYGEMSRKIESGQSLEAIAFDMEALGSTDRGSDFFVPTEISFQGYTIDDHGFSRNLSRDQNFIVSPTGDNYTKLSGLLDDIEQAVDAGSTPRLTSHQERAVADLIKYSEGVNISQANGLTVVKGHSDNYRKFVNTIGGKASVDLDSKAPLRAARQGLEKLREVGASEADIAENLYNYLDSNQGAYFMGHNISRYDIEGINTFLTRHDQGKMPFNRTFDLYEMIKSSFGSPLDMADTVGANKEKMARMNRGLYRLESLVDSLGIETDVENFQAHTSWSDTNAVARASEELFFGGQRDVMGNKLYKQGAASFITSPNPVYNVGALEEGSLLFSTGGASGMSTYGDNQLSFVTQQVGDGRKILDSKRYLRSNAIYRFKGVFKRGNQFELRLDNVVSGETSHIMRSSKDDLANFVYGNMMNVTQDIGNLIDQDVRKLNTQEVQHGIAQRASDWYNRNLKDIARRKYSRLTSSVTDTGSGIWQLDQYYKAARIENKLGTGKQWSSLTDDSIQQIKNVFEHENMFRNYKYMRKRLRKEVDVVTPILENIQKTMPDSSRKEKMIQHLTFVKAYDRLKQKAGVDEVEIDVPAYKQYGFRMTSPTGSDAYIPLQNRSKATKKLNILAKQAMDTETHNYRGLAGHFNTQIDELKQRIVENSQIDEKTTRNMVSDLELTQQMFRRQTTGVGGSRPSLGTPISQLSDVLYRYREQVPFFSEQKRTGFDLTGQTMNTSKLQQLNAENLFRYSQAKVANMPTVFGYSDLADQDFQELARRNKAFRNISRLDENLKDIYRRRGISETGFPESMSQSIKRMLDTMGKEAPTEGAGLAQNLYWSGTMDQPMISLAIYDSNSYGTNMDKSLRQIRTMDDVAVVDIPLINKNQYIYSSSGNPRISPLALLGRKSYTHQGTMDQALNNIEAYTSVGRITRRLEDVTPTIGRMAEEGRFMDLEKMLNRQVNEALGSLSGSTYGTNEGLSSYSQGMYSDYLKKGYINFDELVRGPEGNFMDLKGNKIDGYRQMNYMQNLWQSSSGGNFMNIRDIIGNVLGGRDRLTMAGTRGEHYMSGNISMIDVRDYLPFGFYNRSGRPNMMQAQNIRTLNQSIKQKFAGGRTGMSLNPLVATDMELDRLDFQPKGNIMDSFSDVRYFQSNVSMMNEMQMAESFQQAVANSRYSMGQLGIDSPGNYPSIRENQVIISQSMADMLKSNFEKKKSVDPELDLRLNKDIRDALGRGETVELGYEQKIGRYTDADGNVRDFIFPLKSRHSLRGVKYNEEGRISKMLLTEHFEAREGVTKLMFGSEKFTIRNILPDEIVQAMGDGSTQAIMNAGHASHEAYGDIFEAITKNAMFQINKSDMEMAKKKQAATRVKQLTESLFGLEAATVDVSGNGDFMLKMSGQGRDVLLDSTADMVEKFGQGAIGTEEFVQGIKNIEGIDVQDRALTFSTRLSINDENFHYKAFSGAGQKGRRFSFREVERLRNLGMENYADYLQQGIDSQTDRRLLEQLQGEAKAIDYLYENKVAGTSPDVPGGVERYTANEFLSEDTFKNLRVNKLKGGFYSQDELAGTLLDPNRGTVMVDLPKELRGEIGVRTAGRFSDDAERVSIDSIMMASPLNNPTDKGFTKSEIGRSQIKIREKLREYHRLKARKDEFSDIRPDSTDHTRALRRIKDDLQTEVNKLYQNYYTELTSSQGAASRKIMGGRLKGSGSFNLQIASPLYEMTDENIRETFQAGTEEYGTAQAMRKKFFNNYNVAGRTGAVQRPNTVYMSKNKAKKMLEGADPEYVDKVMKRGRGYGLAHRPPTNYAESVIPVEYRLVEGMDDDTIRITSTMAAAMRGDADSDQLSFSFAYTKNHEDLNRRLKSEVDQFSDILATQRSKVLEDVVEDYRSGKGAELLTGQEELFRYDVGSVFSEQDYAERVARAKLPRASKSGYISNVAEKFRRIGKRAIDDTEEMTTFANALGKIMEQSISSKHAFSTGADHKKAFSTELAPMDIKKILMDTSENYAEMDRLQKSGLLEESEVQVLKKVKKDVLKNEGNKAFNNFLSDLFLSERMADRGGIKNWGEFKSGEVMSSHTRTQMTEKVFKSVSGDYQEANAKAIANELKLRSARKEAGRTGRSLGPVSDEVTQALADNVIKGSDMDIGGGKYGKMAMGLAALGGFMANETANSTEALPMDYVNMPGLQPATPGGQRQNTYRVNEEMLPSAGQAVRQQGLDVVVKGKTTADKDPKELAGVVSQSMQQSLEIPLNVTVNTNDNRDMITDEWIEDKVIESIQA